jgi:hypothetical protein
MTTPIETGEYNKPADILSEIEKNIHLLDESLSRIIVKQTDIERLNEGFSKKTMLYSEEHKDQLKFQSSLLENEKHYLAGLKRNFMGKLSGDIYDLASSVCMLATSITTLEISNDDKSDIMKKVISTKRQQDTTFKTMHTVLGAICQNLDFIKTYLMSFDTHITSIHQKLKTENFHCHNIESHITHKRQQIQLEFDRHTKTLDLHLEYYTKLSANIATQMAHMKLLAFCVE